MDIKLEKYKTVSIKDQDLLDKLKLKSCESTFYISQGYDNENSTNNIMTDDEYSKVVKKALENNQVPPDMIDITD